MKPGSHDAEIVVQDTRTKVGNHGPQRVIATWHWADDRMTMSPTEHEVMKRLLPEAEDRYDLDAIVADYDQADRPDLAKVWLTDGGELATIKWWDE